MRSSVGISCLLFALLVATFVTFYPQLDAAGYCGDGGCPVISYSAHATAGAALGGANASGISFVVAALVLLPGLPARAARLALSSTIPDVLVGVILSPETPPPQPPA